MTSRFTPRGCVVCFVLFCFVAGTTEGRVLSNTTQEERIPHGIYVPLATLYLRRLLDCRFLTVCSVEEGGKGGAAVTGSEGRKKGPPLPFENCSHLVVRRVCFYWSIGGYFVRCRQQYSSHPEFRLRYIGWDAPNDRVL